MLDAKLRIAYLVPDPSLLEHDRLVLEAMGHQVIVPRGAENGWAGAPDPGEPEHQPSAFAELRGRCDCVLTGPDAEYLPALLRGFDGPVILRIVGKGKASTVGGCLSEIGGERIVAMCEKARGRVFIASTPEALLPSREAGELKLGFAPAALERTSSLTPDVRFVVALDGDGLTAADENAVRCVATCGNADAQTLQKLLDLAQGATLPGHAAEVRVGPCLVARPASRGTAPGIVLHALAKQIPVLYAADSPLAGWLGPKSAGAIRDSAEMGSILSRLFANERFASRLGQKLSRAAQRRADTIADAGWPATGMQRFRQFSVARGLRRVAVVLPIAYRGGSIRGFKNVCQMLHRGVREAGGPVEVIAVVPAENYDVAADFADLLESGMSVREFEFCPVAGDLAGPFRFTERGHAVFDDGINDLLDCEFLLFISDRIPFHIPPSLRYGMLNFDCLQRYFPEAVGEDFLELQRQSIMSLVRDAEFVAVTTPAAEEDYRSYFGIPAERVLRVPAFVDVETLRVFGERPEAGSSLGSAPSGPAPYIAWVTNLSPHKNHSLVVKALDLYYGQLGGGLEVRLCGALTDQFRTGAKASKSVWFNVEKTRRLLEERATVRQRLHILGELSDAEYVALIANAAVVLNPSVYDNGSFSAMDGAYAGATVVQSSHPANVFFDGLFQMNSIFFDPHDAMSLARALKQAELGGSRPGRTAREKIEAADWRRLSRAFWDVLGPAMHEAVGVRA